MDVVSFDVAHRRKCKAKRGGDYCFAHGGDTFPLGTKRLLEGSSGLQAAYTKVCPNSAKKITAACWCHVMTPCQVS